MSDTPRSRTVAVVAADLIFGARIRAAAEQAGVRALFARNPDELLRNAAEADAVIVDLDARWLDPDQHIRALRAAPASAAKPVVAFVAHTNSAAIEAARAAGASQVLARSAFVRVLSSIFHDI